MKVRIMSDLHLEFHDDFYVEIPEGDVLILAGDVCIAAEVDNYIPFFEQCVAKYNKVFYVMGNHEHYNGNYATTESSLRAKLPAGITLLQNQSEYYNGVHFVGATMWTNFNLNVESINRARACMNDYHLVDGFTPELAIQENMDTRKWFEQCVPMLRFAPVFMITHHAPSQSSLHGRYKQSADAYANRMEDFIKKNSNIQYWAHGHIHHNNDYMVEQCRIISNPKGYHKCEENPDFGLEIQVEIPTAVTTQ